MSDKHQEKKVEFPRERRFSRKSHKMCKRKFIFGQSATDNFGPWQILTCWRGSPHPEGAFQAALVVKHLPASAGDADSIPGPGRHHIPRTNSETALWSPGAPTTETRQHGYSGPRARAPRRTERPTHATRVAPTHHS